TMLVCFFILQTRLRVRRAPGIPCALFLEGRHSSKLGHGSCRGNVVVCLLRCRASRKRGTQYSIGFSDELCRLWNTGSSGQAGRRRAGCLKFEPEGQCGLATTTAPRSLHPRDHGELADALVAIGVEKGVVVAERDAAIGSAAGAKHERMRQQAVAA